MCGICGFTGADETDTFTLKAMCDVISHRGPDGEGQYLDKGIALGHRRLSLIDLEGGMQPMVRAGNTLSSHITSPALSGDGKPLVSAQDMAAKGDYAIVFNGEIYNYRELRILLQEEGWVFQTNSDTEVLLNGYLAWGEEVLDKIRGMFAFALWNRCTRELFCARDFFGIKPFYYTVQKEHFIFASEIKSILEHPAYERELNEEALEQYLCFQFSALDQTFFKDVFKLAPGHCMNVKADGSLSIRRFWQPEFLANKRRSHEDTVEAIHTTMRESVCYHNVADVEVGSFLSSGIDSSYLAACLAQQNSAIKTFTVGFAEYEGERDEIAWASELAEELHIENHSKHITEQEYWQSLERVQWHMDEPSGDPSAVALYFVDREAAKKVKAVLSGEGADEFFAGYRIYQTPFANKKLSWAPKRLLRGASKLTRSLGIRGANYLERASEKPEDWYYTNANGVAFSVDEREQLRAGKRSCKTVPETPQALTKPVYEQVTFLDETTRMQYVDIAFWLVGDILLKTDKMAMAHSLESRVPFLDKEVFNMARSIPTPLKVNEKQTKITLREAAERVIPKNWAQKEKLGFPVPLVNWLREEHYYQHIKSWFSGSIAQKFFNTHKLLDLLDEHKKGADNARKIWIVYMFLMWYNIYFVKRCAPDSPAKSA